MNRNPLKQQLVDGMVTYDFTPNLKVHDHNTRFWRCGGTAFGHFFFFKALAISWSRLLARV